MIHMLMGLGSLGYTSAGSQFDYDAVAVAAGPFQSFERFGGGGSSSGSTATPPAPATTSGNYANIIPAGVGKYGGLVAAGLLAAAVWYFYGRRK